MGNCTTEIITSTGNERSFLTLIYNYIMDLWDNITCVVSDSSGTVIGDDPEDVTFARNTACNMDFILDESTKLRFQIYPGSDAFANPISSGYNIGLYGGSNIVFNKNLNNTTVQNGSCLHCSASHYTPSTSTTRKYCFTKYDSDNIFILWIGPYTASDFKDTKTVSIIKFKDASNSWHLAGNSKPDIFNGSNVCNMDGTNPATLSPMFSYEARTGYLDFISHSSFVSGSTKVFTSNDVYDCTTVNFGDTLSLKDGANFLAIGAHSMVRLDDEEG